MTDLHEQIAQRLGTGDQRYTSTRRDLVDILRRAGGPVSIPEIQKLAADIPQSSVYRNLAILETAGVVTRVVSNDEFGRFELAEDLIGHHHHLMCESCGAMSDITIPHEIEEQLDSTLGALAKASGFTLSHHRLDLVGKCAKCA
jgi:Fur family ferric uptake transcriptional regulator